MSSDCLTKSRFIAFFDESGDHSLNKIDKDFPLFLLCTASAVFAAEDYPVPAEDTHLNLP